MNTPTILEPSFTAGERLAVVIELVALILEQTNDKATKASCARVCRSWLEVSLDTLWRDIDDISSLFKLLAPLALCDTSSLLEFERPLTSADWDQFHYFGSRVRTLSFTDGFFGDQTNCNYAPVSDSVFQEVERTHPRSAILPNLKRIEWTSSSNMMQFAAIFMHTDIQDGSFTLQSFEIGSVDALKALIYHIRILSPNLKHLSLEAEFASREVGQDLLLLLTDLKKAESIVLPKLWITPAVMAALRNSPCLKALTCQSPLFHTGERRADVKHFSDKFEFQVGDFATLTELYLEASMVDVFPLFNNSSLPQGLQLLSISAIRYELPDVVRSFLTLASEVLPKLQALRLLFKPPVYNLFWLIKEEPTYITFETLKPLLNFQELVEFCINYDTPVDIDEENLQYLAAHWPKLEVLSLCPQPASEPFSTALTVSAILPFAALCPNLRSLALWIDATLVPSLPFNASHQSLVPESGNCQPIQFGTNFSSLDFGTSYIEEMDMKLVSHYLASYLPAHDYLETCRRDGYKYDRDFRFTAGEILTLDKPLLEYKRTCTMFRRIELWRRIGTLLPAMIHVRDEEQKRFVAVKANNVRLKQENEELRTELRRIMSAD